MAFRNLVYYLSHPANHKTTIPVEKVVHPATGRETTETNKATRKAHTLKEIVVEEKQIDIKEITTEFKCKWFQEDS